jgi:hypothetical protein
MSTNLEKFKGPNDILIYFFKIKSYSLPSGMNVFLQLKMTSLFPIQI